MCNAKMQAWALSHRRILALDRSVSFDLERRVSPLSGDTSKERKGSKPWHHQLKRRRESVGRFLKAGAVLAKLYLTKIGG